MNEDLYDTGSAVVGLYRRFTNFFEIPWGIHRTGWIDWGGGGGVSYFFSIKTLQDHQQWGLDHLLPKFEHIFVAVITFTPFLLCRYF